MCLIYLKQSSIGAEFCIMCHSADNFSYILCILRMSVPINRPSYVHSENVWDVTNSSNPKVLSRTSQPKFATMRCWGLHPRVQEENCWHIHQEFDRCHLKESNEPIVMLFIHIVDNMGRDSPYGFSGNCKIDLIGLILLALLGGVSCSWPHAAVVRNDILTPSDLISYGTQMVHGVIDPYMSLHVLVVPPCWLWKSAGRKFGNSCHIFKLRNSQWVLHHCWAASTNILYTSTMSLLSRKFRCLHKAQDQGLVA